MTLHREVVKDAAVGVGAADTPEGLAAIRKPGCAAAIWRRGLPERFTTWVNGLDVAQLPKARLIVRPDQVAKAAAQICDGVGTTRCEERAMLTDDAASLATLFARLMRARHLLLRFDVVTTDACRRFHIDAVTARLICTYRGTGTQYGVSTDGEAPRQIHTVPTGSPILIRGTLWPEKPKSGLLHRSPPIEGSGETRLLLVLDPVKAPDAGPDKMFAH